MTGFFESWRRGKKHLPTAGHYLLFFRVFAWSAAAPILARALSLPGLLHTFSPRREPAEPRPDAMDRAVTIDVYLNFIHGRNPAKSGKNCLSRSLVLYRFLRLSGVPARFHLGVKKEGEALAGHAWVEVDGKPFLEPVEGQDYTPTFSCPAISGDNKKT